MTMNHHHHQHQQHQQHQQRRRVRFSTLEVIELPYCLGDNPSVNGGAPVSISWDCQKRTIVDLGFFEEYRPARRNKSALHLNKVLRRNLLLENGCSEAEIHLATIKAATTRKERMDTIQEIKQKIRDLMAEGVVIEAKEEVDQQRYVASPVPTANPSPGLTPSPIISRKSPMRTMASDASPCTRLAHLRFPSSPGRGFLSPQCHIRHKRSVPIDLGNDIFSMDSIRYDPFDDRAARICSPKHQVCSSPRSFLSAQQQYIPTRRRDVSPTVDTQPPIQPRRLASPVGSVDSPRQPETSSCPSSVPQGSGWSSTRMSSSTQRLTLPVAAPPPPMQPRRFASTAPVVLFQPPTPPR